MTGTRNETSGGEVARYRVGVARLLGNAIRVTAEIEGSLGVTIGPGEWEAVPARAGLEDDPTAAYRITCALLLRKARLHTVAVLHANETGNLHSLAVQMRPVLECAGQVVFVFHNLVIKPKGGKNALLDYIDADCYRTVIGATKGEVGHKELVKTISEVAAAEAASVGLPKPKPRRWRSLKQADKVATLVNGRRWYDHLSEYFCHGRAEWRGRPWRGGVTAQDEFSPGALMDYLVHQVAVMNAYAALWSVEGDTTHARVKTTLTQLHEVRRTCAALRQAALPSAEGTGAKKETV